MKRDNDIMSETSLGQDCFLSAAECRQRVVHQVDLISGCGLQAITSPKLTVNIIIYGIVLHYKTISIFIFFLHTFSIVLFCDPSPL